MMLFSCAPTVIGEAPLIEDGTVLSGWYVVDGRYLYNVYSSLTSDELISAVPTVTLVESKGTYIGTGSVISFGDGSKLSAVVRGDVDGNGRVTAADYLMTKRYCLGTFNAEEIQVCAMREGDSVVSSDYLKIKRAVLGSYNLFANPHLSPDGDFNGVRVAYIPLDNRPVNKDRVIYAAEAAGFELLIPDEDLFRTALDNMSKNENGGTYGDRAELMEWLKTVEDECDYFVISLDQMLSGGLVASRWLSNTDLSLEYEIADYLISLAKRKHVVFFDTVMRLASTVNYMGYSMEEYNLLRAYGSVGRPVLTGDELNVENIIKNYPYNESGKTIQTSLSSAKKELYFASRARKLRLIDYVLSNASEHIEYLFIGVDDSSPQNTVQSNEINYIESISGSNTCTFAGADELGMMGLARISSFLYGAAEANVTYYGGGEGLEADAFDYSTLDDNVTKHLACVGATKKSNADNALQILILTKTSDIQKHAESLVNQLRTNLANKVPTVVIDCSTNTGALQARLAEKDIPLSMLLGYSNWNTVGNSVGIALSQGVSRYLYINKASVTESANEAFLKSMTFAYIKDISYKCAGISIDRIARDTSQYGGKTLLSLINSSEILVGEGSTVSHGAVTVSNFRYPWDRTFEMTFDISVAG